MLVGSPRIDLFLAGVRSLKGKRAPLKRLISQLQNKQSVREFVNKSSDWQVSEYSQSVRAQRNK